jgi:hypothetical protein
MRREMPVVGNPEVCTFGGGQVPYAQRARKVEFLDRRPATPARQPPAARGAVATAVAGLVNIFQDQPAMSRQQLIQALEAAGLDTSSLTDQIPDSFLQDVLDLIQQGNANPTPPPGEPEPVQPVPAQQFSHRNAGPATDSRGLTRRQKIMSGMATGRELLRSAGEPVDPRAR